MIRKYGIIAAVLAAATLPMLGAVSASAVITPTSVTATTAISNRPDGGHGSPSTWAYDTFTRKLTVTTAPDAMCSGLPSGDTCYTATVSDSGTFETILGAGTPNGTGGQINHHVSGTIAGTGSYVFYAPGTDTLTGTVPATEDDNFSSSGSGFVSSGNWPAQAFATPADVVMNPGENVYSYKYASTCESWTDSSTNNDGQGAADGNITGLNFCAVAHSNVVQIKNRATGKCLNEDRNTGLLSTYACLPQTYASLRWQVVTYSDGTRDLVSVQTGGPVRDNGQNAQLSLTGSQSPMQFQNGGIFRFPDSLVIGVNRQGNFIPVIGSPSYSNLDNVRWDFGAIPA